MKATTTWLIVTLAVATGGCSTAPKTQEERDVLHIRANASIESFKARDPGLARFFESSEAFAIFPAIGKAAFIAGGAWGRGEFHEAGVQTGWCDMTQGTVGLQIGGQSYQEIIFFRSKNAVKDFKNGDFAFSAQASAVAATAGASATADYKSGVLVFTMIRSGLMYEASIGGQNFEFVPIR